MLSQTGLRDNTEVIAAHQQDKQGKGKHDAHGEHFDRAVGLSFVLDKIIEGAGEAGQYEDDKQQGKDAHEWGASTKFKSNRIAGSVHLMNLRIGAWQFAPTLWPTLAALLFFVLTLWLGNWQSERAETKRALQARYDTAAEEAPIHLGSTLLDRDSLLYRKLEVRGVYDDAHTILLDNRVVNGVAGYYVLTPLKIDGDELAILVNRGWIAAGRTRAQVPRPPTPTGRIRLEGMAVDPHSRFLELAPTVPQGRVWQNLDFARYTATSRLKLHPVLLLQTSALDDGLLRSWPRPDTGVSMHVSYAVQWYSLAATLAVLWLVMNVKRHRGDDV